MLAVRRGSVDVVRALLAAHADPNAGEPKRDTVLDNAELALTSEYPGALEILKLLLAAGADVGRARTSQILNAIIEQGDTKQLPQTGATAAERTIRPSGKDTTTHRITPPAARDDHSSLCTAVQTGDLELVEWAHREQPTNTECRATSRHALIHIAGAWGDADIVAFLIGNGESVSTQQHGWDGRRYYGTPLHAAALHGEWQVVPTLVASGPDVINVPAGAKHAFTPLHTAILDARELPIANDRLRTVDALLGAGADVNARTDEGATALDLALAKVNSIVDLLVIERLLRAGATVSAANSVRGGEADAWGLSVVLEDLLRRFGSQETDSYDCGHLSDGTPLSLLSPTIGVGLFNAAGGALHNRRYAQAAARFVRVCQEQSPSSWIGLAASHARAIALKLCGKMLDNNAGGDAGCVYRALMLAAMLVEERWVQGTFGLRSMDPIADLTAVQSEPPIRTEALIGGASFRFTFSGEAGHYKTRVARRIGDDSWQVMPQSAAEGSGFGAPLRELADSGMLPRTMPPRGFAQHLGGPLVYQGHVNGCTSLLLAVRRGADSVVRGLLESGVEPDVSEMSGAMKRALATLPANPRNTMVRLLGNAGARYE
jgi:hypothetical protein